ncbi:MAG: hypothetical protein KGJ60_05545 [Verrucomicrobiota bacterium]|nr:hypothetical protein [Verrucomicrobiota bacterium]
MKTTTKARCWTLGLAVAGCAMGMSLPPRAVAEVSDADFNALKETVQKLSEELHGLERTNAVAAQVHQRDQEQIRQLQQKLAETQQLATNTEQRIVEAAQTQPIPRQPIDEATVNHNFMILGDAEVQYAKTSGQHGAFLLADFAPIFLYRAGDNILFEAGFDTTLQNGSSEGTTTNASGQTVMTPGTHDSGASASFDLSFAQLDYVMNDYLTFMAGDLLLPLGTYSERSAGWLNEIPDDPLAVGLVPGAGVGAQLQGAVPLGDSGSFVNYQVYGVNGPSSSNGTGNPDALDLGGNVGLRSDNTVANLHGQPSGGARLGVFLPFPYKPHYDLEVGISGQSGEWDDAGNHLWSAGVLDAALHLGPYFETKGEYVMTRFGSDSGQIHQQGWWVQTGYKLAGLDLEMPVVNNVELVGRYDSLHDGLGTSTQRYTLGFIYYITNTLLVEGDYEFLHSTDPSQANQLLLQLSLGF